LICAQLLALFSETLIIFQYLDNIVTVDFFGLVCHHAVVVLILGLISVGLGLGLVMFGLGLGLGLVTFGLGLGLGLVMFGLGLGLGLGLVTFGLGLGLAISGLVNITGADAGC